MKLNGKRSLKLHLAKHIKNLVNWKKLFWRKWKCNKTDYNKKVLNNISKVCSEALFDFNKDTVDSLLNSKNIKGFYSYVNNKIGRMKAPVTLKDDDRYVLGEQESVNVFAEYFHSVYSKDYDFLPHFDKRSNVLLSNIEIDVVEVDRSLRTLPSKYSSGIDNIPNILQKKLHSLLYQKLNTTSLTSNVCKVMESIIYDEIYNHCVPNKLLSESQHGFRKKEMYN